VLVCDALKMHEVGARDGPDIVLADCWAHVFRKFEEAEPARRATDPIKLFTFGTTLTRFS
jgi:hypothetical protein